MSKRARILVLAFIIMITLACGGNDAGGLYLDANVLAYKDTNGNGVRDAGEPPLPGLQVVNNRHGDVHTYTTDANGKVWLETRTDCDPDSTRSEAQVYLSLTPPAGMHITTGDPLQATVGCSMFLSDHSNQDFVVGAALGTPTTPQATESPTASPSPTETATETLSAPIEAPSATATIAAAVPSNAVVTSDLLSCRYGPGAAYLYEWGLKKDDQLEVRARMDTAFGTWLYVKPVDADRPCWVNSKFVDLGGADVASLPTIYPDGAPLILFTDPKWVPSRFFPPTDVSADRYGNLVQLSWTGLVLATGDRESSTSPRFLVEAWTCIGGQIAFSPIGVGADFQGTDMSLATFGAQVQDDAGCAEASHAQVYLAHKDGYVGPVAIPWPAAP